MWCPKHIARGEGTTKGPRLSKSRSSQQQFHLDYSGGEIDWTMTIQTATNKHASTRGLWPTIGPANDRGDHEK